MWIFVIALLNCSSDVNIVHEGSPSRILRVLLISLGMTILPKSSTLLTIPVAVPDICLRRWRSLASVDRCHSLWSLYPPPAALPSLPNCATPGFLGIIHDSRRKSNPYLPRESGENRICLIEKSAGICYNNKRKE
jgi:hypothetical protein